MFLLQAIILLSFVRNVFDKKTRVITAKATTKYDCPPLEPDSGTCTQKYGAANTYLTTEAEYTSNGAIAAVNAFIDACNASKCQAGCSELVSNVALAEYDAELGFADVCAAKTGVPTDDITSLCVEGVTNDEDECDGAYTAVITATTTSKVAPAVAWVPATVKAAIATFSSKCTKTACIAACKGVISARNVVNEFTNLKTNFTRDCNPNPPTPLPPAGDGDLHLFTNKKPWFVFVLCCLGLGLID
jgi:hypothetical protein